MYLLTKEGDDLAIVFAPEEKLRIGDNLDIDGIVAQVIDIQFADLRGVLEHILRKSLITKSETQEHIQPEVKSIIDSLTDQKLAIAKIRGRLVETIDETEKPKKVFKTGLSEFNISRSKAKIVNLNQQELFDALDLCFPGTCDFAKTLSTDPKSFDVLAERWGINLITGMKGSGKSYAAKRILLKLIERNVLTIVFDLNGEYLNLWKAEENKPNRYSPAFRILKPGLTRATAFESPFLIPLNEISYDDFAKFFNVPEGSSTYQQIFQFWRKNKNIQFDLNDFATFVESVSNEAVKAALVGRIESAKGLGIFGPSNLTTTISDMSNNGGALVINLAQVSSWERGIVVDFILRKLTHMGQSGTIKPISLFLEEAQLYVDQSKMINILTRMRHLGIFPTFITNDPRTLPDEVYSLLDNLIAFMFKNEDELRQLAKSGFIDKKSIDALKHLEKRQCIVVGNLTSNYPIFVQIEPQAGVVMGGETKKLVS
ncbi:MAG: ATP-binding protein [Tenericutes bacterium]|nr:ATP-binding protein [Mycoplasmatota bacterium]